MTMTRRTFLAGSAAGLAGGALGSELMAARKKKEAAVAKIRISARHFGAKLDLAKQAGLEGVELGVGGPADTLQIAGADYRKQIKQQMKATGVVVSSLSMDLLNRSPVATEAKAPAWVTQCIEAAADLGAKDILVPFFGPANLLGKDKSLKTDAVDALVARMKELAPIAAKAGVVLGLENTCSGKQNLEILGRINSDAVGCYYDIGNSTHAGYESPAEIRQLKGRLPIFHFKDGKNYLGEGKVNMQAVAESIKAIGYEGWIVLETSCPSKNAVADCKRNADYIRKLLGLTA